MSLAQKPPPLLIQVDRISKSYTHGTKTTRALELVSLNIHQSDIYGIIGLSGAGKSTLIRCLSRLIIPTSGHVLFRGDDLALMDKHALRTFRKNVGMIFQHFNLLSSRTVAENISYPMEITTTPPELREERVDHLLHLVGLTSKKHLYISQLSGGEKQRVGIARALANQPEVLLCDEATSALDPKTTREILHLLKTINQTLGVTIVLITHDMEVIKQICNKVAVIDQGTIVESGLVTDIFAEPQHPVTKHFLQGNSHHIPKEFFKEESPNKKLLRLRFKGAAAEEPVISELVRKFDLNANILLGWIDHVHTISIGTLVVELTGTPQSIEQALVFLTSKHVHYEVLHHGL